MDWITALATGIAIFRIALICGGMFLILRHVAKPTAAFSQQQKCFAAAGVIYMLGLIPQSVLLLIDSENANYMLDNGYLCYFQNFACIVAAALHDVIFFNWILDYTVTRTAKLAKTIHSPFPVLCKSARQMVVIYVTFFVVCRCFFLQNNNEAKLFYMDLATWSESDNHWTMSPVKNPSQAVRLQLLLCEISLPEQRIWSFLLLWIIFLMLPFPLIFCASKERFLAKFEEPRIVPTEEIEEEVLQVDSEPDYVWWEQEINIQRFSSALVVLWYHVIQPVIFISYREYFVDFGTHFLLTVCVFMPLVYKGNQQLLQSWV